MRNRHVFGNVVTAAGQGEPETAGDAEKRPRDGPGSENQKLRLRHHGLYKDVHRPLAGTAVPRQRHHILAIFRVGKKLFRPQAYEGRLTRQNRCLRRPAHRRCDTTAAKPAFGIGPVLENDRLHARLGCGGRNCPDHGRDGMRRAFVAKPRRRLGDPLVRLAVHNVSRSSSRAARLSSVLHGANRSRCGIAAAMLAATGA